MLTPGDRLGPYEIVAALGAGGMGEVYRARDSRLNRTVALKVLSSHLAATPDLEARFEREARAIAALQHPHICVLHDVGREGATAYLVMEYLEGETLAARLHHGPLPLADLAALGGQIADALERAHRAGIVHRDLKPGNVMLVKSGAQPVAKLLDFGLAKPRSAAGATPPPSFTATLAPTLLNSPVTQAGMVVGTVQYMSPEQLEGKEADARSDIFAFGCVLFEMAAGKPAFAGKSGLSVASAILESDPPPVAPPALDRLIRACLAKDPDTRLQSAHDAGLMLGALATDAAAPAPAPATRRRPLWALAAALVAGAAIAAAVMLWLRPRPAIAESVTGIAPPPGEQFDFGGIFPGPPVISPDGRKVVFSARNSTGNSALWLRSLDNPQPRKLPDTQGAVFPFWSPDSTSIGYFTSVGITGNGNGPLAVLNLAGGLPRDLTGVTTTTARGGTWAPDGTIVFAPSAAGGLMRESANGGPVTPACAFDAARFSSNRYPYFLPDGKHFLYLAISHDDSAKDMLYLASLDGRMNRPLVHSLTGGIYADGRLLYSANGTLMAQPLDASTGALSGSPQPVVRDVYDDPITWRPAYSASRTGVLVYASGSMGAQKMVWADRSGELGTALPSYGGEAFTASLSPDGRQLAVSLDQGLQDIWTEGAMGGERSRLTFGPIANLYPVWSPDGKWIAYAGGTPPLTEIEERPAAGGLEKVLGAPPHAAPGMIVPAAWSPDGREILCWLDRGNGQNAMVALQVSDGMLRMVASPSAVLVSDERLSPDGRWASYLAGEMGKPSNLFVVPFRGGNGTVWQVTTDGAVSHFWAKGGRELDIVDSDGRLLAIPVTVSGDAPSFGSPQVLATNFPAVLTATADGQHFLAILYPDDQQRLRVVNGWTQLLFH